MSSCGMGRDVHSLMLSIQLQGAPKDGFGDAVMASDMKEKVSETMIVEEKWSHKWSHITVVLHQGLCCTNLFAFTL